MGPRPLALALAIAALTVAGVLAADPSARPAVSAVTPRGDPPAAPSADAGPGAPRVPGSKLRAGEAGPPLEMVAERLDLDVEAKTAVLSGRVRLTRGDLRVSCPRVDVRYDEVPNVTWARGSGGVIAEVKGVRAEAPEVEIDLAKKTLELRGGVRLARGDGWITAERATIHIATAKISMTEVKGSIPVPAAAP